MKEKGSILCFVLVLFLFNSYSREFKPNSVTSQYGFIENKGQIIDQNNNPNPNVLYLWNGNGINVQLKLNGFSYEVVKTMSKANEDNTEGDLKQKKDKVAKGREEITKNIHRIDIEIVGSNPTPVLETENRSDNYINYYTFGAPETGITNVHHYKKVTYKDIYPNIDVEFLIDVFEERKFKYNFIVRPGGKVNDIQLKYTGAERVFLNKDGDIECSTSSGSIKETIPLSYELNSSKEIAVKYKDIGSSTIGFETGKYNNQETLIIDPWATYFGGSGSEGVYGMATDNLGNALIVGVTSSGSNIATAGSYQSTIVYSTSDNQFMAKFNGAGTVIWSTYYYTGGYSAPNICTDIMGNIIICGTANLNSYVATSGAHQVNYGGGNTDAFLAKFNGNGIRLWGTYLGGTSEDRGTDVATDSSGNIILTGGTGSINNISTPGSFQPLKLNGIDQAFIAKFNQSGVRLWGTYYGGYGGSGLNSVAIDNNDNIVATGGVPATNVDTLSTPNTYQSSFGGGTVDAFVVKFTSTGGRLWGTYLGGGSDEETYDIAIDPSNSIYITGYTYSSDNIASAGAFSENRTGNADAFIVKLNSFGGRIWGTYLGGNQYDAGNGITTDYLGNVYITGLTLSVNNIATPNSYQASIGGGADAFIVKFDSVGSRVWGSYFGGILNDWSEAVAVDQYNNIFIAGRTLSLNNIATNNAQQIVHSGSMDAFIALFNNSGQLSDSILTNVILNPQSVCYNSQPQLITGSFPSGSIGAYTYIWLQSTTDSITNYVSAVGINNQQNYQPALLSSTTWFRRIVSSGTQQDTSNAIKVEVKALPSLTSSPNLTFCNGQITQPIPLTGLPNGIIFDIYNGAVTGLSNQFNVTSIPSFVASIGTSVITILPHANGCIGNASTHNINVTNCPPVPVNLKFYFQGYYNTSGTMQQVLLNQGIISDPLSDLTDVVIVELHSTTPPYSIVKSAIGLLKTNGTLTCSFNGSVTNTPYYIVIRHRNSVPTWSASPVILFPNVSYDFSNAANKVFGGNQYDVSGNGTIWAFYTGDINQDENTDLLDLSLLEGDIVSFLNGYIESDLNGDGNVDLLDLPLLENNIIDFIFSIHP